MDKEKYSSDSPVNTESEDKFSRWKFAERIAEIISERKDPSSITIGLYGPWGDGKTSVLNFIEESIKKKDKSLAIRFNPWLFGSIESLLSGFFNVLAKALDVKLITKCDQIKRFFKKVGPGVTSALGYKGVGDAVGAFLHDPDVVELRNRIKEKLTESQKRILVIIDDVDRLEKTEIQTIFKLVKLVADFQYTTYILAFDKDVVAASLSENYSGASENSGEQFLEKIIQVPLQLPLVPAKDLMDFCFQGVYEALRVSQINLTEQQAQEFWMEFTGAFSRDLKTPRKAKLYSNILMFSLPMLKGEVNPVDLMLLEGLRIFSPKLYEVIRKNKDSFAGTFQNSYHHDAKPEKQKIKDLINGALSCSDNQDSSGYTELLKNRFPKLQSVYGNMHYDSNSHNEWYKGQRICAKEYFDRYFIYSVPIRDFSDTAISQLLNAVEQVAKSISSDNNPLQAALTADNSGVLISKLSNKASSMNEGLSSALSIAVCLMATKYPNPKSMFGWGGPHTQAAMLVSNLVQNIKKSNRVSHVVECVKKTTTPQFQLEVFRWLRRKSEDKPEKDYFNSNEIDIIGNEVANEIECYVVSIDDMTKKAMSILPYAFHILNKYSKRQVVIDHVTSLLENDKSAIIKLLDAYTPNNFEREQYNAITTVFDPKFLLQAIKKELGELPEVQKDFDYGDRSGLLHQFVWFHRQVLAEKNNEKA